MKLYTFLMIVIIIMNTGCFDSSPPAGVTGELVGCITADDDLYCTTKYADAGANNATTVLIGRIDFDTRSAGSVAEFRLGISYTDEDGDEVYRTILVESLRKKLITGEIYSHGERQYDNGVIKLVPGDTVAVAIVNPPTILLPHQGYIIANLTRPDVPFEIPEEVGDVDILDLIP